MTDVLGESIYILGAKKKRAPAVAASRYGVNHSQEEGKDNTERDSCCTEQQWMSPCAIRLTQWECIRSAGMWLGRFWAAVIWLSARKMADSLGVGVCVCEVGVGGCNQGLMSPNRKHHQTNTPSNMTEMRHASWLSLSNMTSSQVISV